MRFSLDLKKKYYVLAIIRKLKSIEKVGFLILFGQIPTSAPKRAKILMQLLHS